jgi:hypothetical protein
VEVVIASQSIISSLATTLSLSQFSLDLAFINGGVNGIPGLSWYLAASCKYFGLAYWE